MTLVGFPEVNNLLKRRIPGLGHVELSVLDVGDEGLPRFASRELVDRRLTPLLPLAMDFGQDGDIRDTPGERLKRSPGSYRLDLSPVARHDATSPGVLHV